MRPRLPRHCCSIRNCHQGLGLHSTTLKNLNWDIDYSKPVQLFGPNIFDPPGAVEDDEYLVRLWFSDGLYENADIGTDAPEGGNATWQNQWVTN